MANLKDVESVYITEYKRGASDCYNGLPTHNRETLAYLEGYSDMYSSEQSDTNKTLQGTH